MPDPTDERKAARRWENCPTCGRPDPSRYCLKVTGPGTVCGRLDCPDHPDYKFNAAPIPDKLRTVSDPLRELIQDFADYMETDPGSPRWNQLLARAAALTKE